MDLCTYDDILDAIQITNKTLLHFKLSKSGQILRVDKTCFPRPSHNYACECPIIPRIMPTKSVTYNSQNYASTLGSYLIMGH